jgi:hypothetical protein
LKDEWSIQTLFTQSVVNLTVLLDFENISYQIAKDFVELTDKLPGPLDFVGAVSLGYAVDGDYGAARAAVGSGAGFLATIAISAATVGLAATGPLGSPTAIVAENMAERPRLVIGVRQRLRILQFQFMWTKCGYVTTNVGGLS